MDNADEAVAVANDSVYGLTATIHTRDMFQALEMARRLEHGQIHFNAATVNDDLSIPVSGAKGSGWGNNDDRYGAFLVSI